jgi:hypothetical protein
LILVTGTKPAAETLNATSGELPFHKSHARGSDAVTLGAKMMSTTEARKPRPRRLLDGFPPDTRIVVMGVTWEDYDRFSRDVREGENCRVAFDGKDIELTTSSSQFLHVQTMEVARWVFVEELPRGLAWEQRLRVWVRNEVAPRAISQ